MGAKLQHFFCRSCRKTRALSKRYQGSDWCVECVEQTLAAQEREARDCHQRRQIVEWDPGSGDE